VKFLEDRIKSKKGKKSFHANSLEKNRKREKKGSDSDSNSSTSAGEALETYLCELNLCELETHVVEAQSNPTWVLNSGATHHVTGNSRFLHNLQKASYAGGMTAVGGETHRVAGYGDVFVKFHDGEIKNIKNVLYVLGIHRNLLSVGRIADQGYRVEFSSNRATIWEKDTKDILCRGSRMSGKGLYRLDIECINILEACTVEKDKNLQQVLLWHICLGHLNFEILHQLLRQGAVKGMPRLPRVKHICETCQLGKLARKRFKTRRRITTEPLELIHSDVCGPIGDTAVTGARYFITFSDDFSRKTWVYMLKTKDQAYDRFKTFKSEVENQTGKRIKTLRTDNGGEYTSRKFQELCDEAGIRHGKSQPYTPQSNGLAERKNRTLVETARCLCYQSSLPIYLWSEAIRAACYLLNRRPTKALGMKTPEEIFTRKTPDISNLRIFGTKVFVSIHKHRRTKMEAKASTCILLGIDDLTKGYRCYCPITKCILISRDIIVEESRSGSYIIGEENPQTFPFQLFHMNMTQHHPGTPITPTTTQSSVQTTPPMVMEHEFPDTAQEPARNPSSPDLQELGSQDISRETLSPAPVPILPNSLVVYTRKPRLE
jgi:transposase InsO family protein